MLEIAARLTRVASGSGGDKGAASSAGGDKAIGGDKGAASSAGGDKAIVKSKKRTKAQAKELELLSDAGDDDSVEEEEEDEMPRPKKAPARRATKAKVAPPPAQPKKAAAVDIDSGIDDGDDGAAQQHDNSQDDNDEQEKENQRVNLGNREVPERDGGKASQQSYKGEVGDPKGGSNEHAGAASQSFASQTAAHPLAALSERVLEMAAARQSKLSITARQALKRFNTGNNGGGAKRKLLGKPNASYLTQGGGSGDVIPTDMLFNSLRVPKKALRLKLAGKPYDSNLLDSLKAQTCWKALRLKLAGKPYGSNLLESLTAQAMKAT
eukprot:gene4780-34538_t